MRAMMFFAVAIPLTGQNPVARITNVSHPGSVVFQVGDRFEVAITGAANQPVSVRTTMQGRTDWGPVIGSTDAGGRWSVSGQFDKADFGGWREVWTVGGKVANPVISFFVTAPCLTGGRGMLERTSSQNSVLSCDTETGQQSFVTPSDGDPFRTPDGRVIPGPLHPGMDIASMTRVPTGSPLLAKRASQDLDLIVGAIGVNALTEEETRRVLTVVRDSRRTTPAIVALLQRLADGAEEERLKQEIAETIALVRAQ